jgi:hypothetical protein
VAFFTVSVTVLPALETVPLTVSVSLEPVELADASGVADAFGDALADGVADGEGLADEPESLPPPSRPPSVSPMVSSRPPLLLDADGVGEAEPLPEPEEPEPEEPEVALGVGVALPPEPESDEEDDDVEDDDEDEGVVSEPFVPALAEGDGVAESDALAEADGVGEAELSLPAICLTQFLYSSAFWLFDVVDGDGLLPLSARASVDVKPMPISTAVGIATEAIALPAGMWNLVNSGFLGAAWRGPVLSRDPSTSVSRVASSAGTVPPVRPVGRARS